MKKVWIRVPGRGALAAEDAKVTPLLTKDLTGIAANRRHDADRGVCARCIGPPRTPQCPYVCLCAGGSVVMQVKGGKEVTLGPADVLRVRRRNITPFRKTPAVRARQNLVFLREGEGDARKRPAN